MTLYRIGLMQTVYEGADVYIEANNKEEAEELAMKQAEGHLTAGHVEWKFVEALGDIEVVEVDQVVGPPALDRAIRKLQIPGTDPVIRGLLGGSGADG